MDTEQILKRIEGQNISANKIIIQASDIPKDWNVIISKIGEILMHSGAQFEIDPNNSIHISNIVAYFHGQKLDTNKGIMLVGPVGTGKTLMMQIMQQYSYNFGLRTFSIIDAREIIKTFTKNGYEGLEHLFIAKYRKMGEIAEPMDYCIDDFGSEAGGANHYGTNTNPVIEALLDRYNLFKRNGTRTHITTNLGPKEITERYGERIGDRFREMFNVIVLDGKTRRK